MGVSQSLKVIAGRYRLDSLLGEGGMASVWRARDLTLARPVAVKLLFARDERDHEQLVARFLREARIAAAVQHRNVIHIVDFGTTEDGQPYMVMELLEGESLGDRLHRERMLPLAEAVHIASMTLRGLSAVHDAGIIHRDLKPDNIYLKEEGGVVYPKILDFGISRSVEPSSGRRSALTTREGIIVGTPEYMSPEQARGLKELDHRTDIYSMGVILYQMLAGKLPLQSENVGDLIIKIVTSQVPSVHEENPAVPVELSDVVARAMSKLPQERYADATQMQNALHAAADRALGEGRRSLSDTPPPSLTIPDGIPIRRGEPLVSREFPLLTTEAQELPSDAAQAIGDADRSGAVRPLALTPTTLPNVPINTADFTERLTGRKRRPLLVPALLLALAGGALLFFVLKSEPEEIRSSPVPAARTEAATVTVRLRNLPQGAVTTLDGAAVSGDSIELPKDGRARTLRVVAEGKQPWQAVYSASHDWTYDVVLEDAPAPPIAAPAPAAQAAPTVRSGQEAARPKPGRKRTSAPSALRHLDF